MLTLPVKLMAKQQCMRCIDANSASETDGQTTLNGVYCMYANCAYRTGEAG